MTILKLFKDPLSRQIEEATRISEAAESTLIMNSRAEWRSTPLPQVAFTQGRVPQGSAPVYRTSIPNLDSTQHAHQHSQRPPQVPAQQVNHQQAPQLGKQVPQVPAHLGQPQQALQRGQLLPQVPAQQVHPQQAPQLGQQVPQVPTLLGQPLQALQRGQQPPKVPAQQVHHQQAIKPSQQVPQVPVHLGQPQQALAPQQHPLQPPGSQQPTLHLSQDPLWSTPLVPRGFHTVQHQPTSLTAPPKPQRPGHRRTPRAENR